MIYSGVILWCTTIYIYLNDLGHISEFFHRIFIKFKNHFEIGENRNINPLLFISLLIRIMSGAHAPCWTFVFGMNMILLIYILILMMYINFSGFREIIRKSIGFTGELLPFFELVEFTLHLTDIFQSYNIYLLYLNGIMLGLPLSLVMINFTCFIIREYFGRNHFIRHYWDTLVNNYQETPKICHQISLFQYTRCSFKETLIDDICNYCHEIYNDNDPEYYRTKCGHHAHVKCFESWWRYSNCKKCIYPFCG